MAMESSELLAKGQVYQPVLVHSSRTTIRGAAWIWMTGPVRMTPTPKTKNAVFTNPPKSGCLVSARLLILYLFIGMKVKATGRSGREGG